MRVFYFLTSNQNNTMICKASPNWWLVLAHNTLVRLAIASNATKMEDFVEEIAAAVFFNKTTSDEIGRLAHLPKDRLAHLIKAAWMERMRYQLCFVFRKANAKHRPNKFTNKTNTTNP